MSKSAFTRARKAVDKASAHYKVKPSRRNWKRFRRALARYAAY